ncbi:MAG: hypothetical protein CME05_09100 [Gemmatimonadaceae bacterium]|nr:hypothetical protein [Gemmatimonadaceae bacterium]
MAIQGDTSRQSNHFSDCGGRGFHDLGVVLLRPLVAKHLLQNLLLLFGGTLHIRLGAKLIMLDQAVLPGIHRILVVIDGIGAPLGVVRLLQEHDGEILVTSQPGQGTQVTMTLPVRQERG